MNRTIRNLHKLSLLVLFVFLAVAAGAAEFVIFHTSDTHGAISARPDPNGKEGEKRIIGGFAVLRNLIESYRANPAHKNARIMYLDSGDFFQGTPIVDRTKGGVMIDFLNHMNVAAVTLGNHEFDYTYQNLVEQFKSRKFPVICCNVFEKNTGMLPEFSEPYRIYTHQGRKIGIIGVDTPETATITFEKNVKDLIFCQPEPIVTNLVKLLRRSGVDFILVNPVEQFLCQQVFRSRLGNFLEGQLGFRIQSFFKVGTAESDLSANVLGMYLCAALGYAEGIIQQAQFPVQFRQGSKTV